MPPRNWYSLEKTLRQKFCWEIYNIFWVFDRNFNNSFSGYLLVYFLVIRNIYDLGALPYKSRHLMCFVKKGVLKNLAILPVLESLLSWEYCEIFNNTILKNTWSTANGCSCSYTFLFSCFLSARVFHLFIQCLFKPFHAIGLFLYPLKTSENLGVFDVYRGYRKISVA